MTEITDVEKFEKRSPGQDYPAALADPDPFVAMVERLGTNPNVDVDKLERIMKMQERIIDKQAEQQYNSSMVGAQGEMPEVPEDARNQQTGSNYSKLKTIIKYCSPVWKKHGFSQSFHEEKSDTEGMVRAAVHVMHQDGHTKQYWTDIPIDDKGIKGSKNKTDTHAKVSSLTYGQSKLLKMIYNIPTGEGDDDGQAAGNAEFITQEQAGEITKRLKPIYGEDASMFMTWLASATGAETIDTIPAKDFKLVDKTIADLERKAKQRREPGSDDK